MGRPPLAIAAFFLVALTAHAATPTFARDVAPILYQHCATCHHPGEVAPFPLLSYADAARRARQIAEVTASRYMPPWKAVGGHFQNERRLSLAQIDTLRRWAAAGAPEGDPKTAPPVPQFSADGALGKPDLVLQLPKPFAIPADGPDLYQCFVVPTGFTRDRYLRAFEFRPSNRRIVHHALVYSAMHLGGLAGSYPCFGSVGTQPSSGVGGWSPGNIPRPMFPGTAVWIPAHADLIIQIHYHPTGKPEEDQSSVGLYFADRPPTRHVADIGLTSRQIDIPPGATDYKVRDHFTVPVDVDAIAIVPHAHYICKKVEGWAILPNGRRIQLLRIDDWDFNWQDQYLYQQPLRLPEDTRVEMELTYDNSESNPHNPNHPPKRVRWGAGVTDEMAGLHIEVIPVRDSDMHELGLALWGKVMREVGGSFYRLPPKEPQ